MSPRKPNLPKYLLVDDDPSWLNFIKLLVGKEQLLVCADSTKAIDVIRAKKPQVLITDTNMPKVTGVDLLRLIRQDPALKDLPVIVLFSGLNGTEITKKDLITAGATLVITKDEFLANLGSLLPGSGLAR